MRSTRSTMSAAKALARLAKVDIAFIRHANTGPSATDLARQLTDKGKAQSKAAAMGYMTRLPSPLASFVISSPAQRCLETADIVLEGSSPPEMMELQCIYDGMLQPGASETFGRLGYASLFTYLADNERSRTDLNAHGETVIGSLGAAVAVRAVLDAADGTVKERNDQRQTLCVFGHAVYLAAAALRLADLRAHPLEAREMSEWMRDPPMPQLRLFLIPLMCTVSDALPPLLPCACGAHSHADPPSRSLWLLGGWSHV